MIISRACLTNLSSLRPLVTVAEVKRQARVDGDDEDEQIFQYANAASAAVENATNRCFRGQQWRVYWDRVTVGCREFVPFCPASTVSLERRSGADAWTAETPFIEKDSGPGFFYPNKDAFVPLDGSPTWKATVTAKAEPLPADLKTAVLMLAAHFYESRTPVSHGVSVAEIPRTIGMLIDPHIAHIDNA